MSQTNNNNISLTKALLQGSQDSLSMSAALALFGFVFGVLADVAGLSLINTTAMSMFMFAGAAQMISLNFWDPEHLPVFAMIFTAMVICLRFTLMGITLQPLTKRTPVHKIYPSLQFLMDEVWAIALLKNRKKGYRDQVLWAYYLGSGLTFYVFWIASTIIGAIIGHSIENPAQYGLDFALIVIFLALLIGMRRGKQDIIPWAVAAIVAILSAHFIPGSWYIIIGALVGSMVGVWREYH